MKEIIKKIIPSSILNIYRKLYLRRTLNNLYKFDRKRFSNGAYNLRDNYTFTNLRSKITMHYHSIEKGLSNSKFRAGFGKSAFSDLFFSMDKYIELDFPSDDSRFQHAISTIENYINVHKNIGYNVDKVQKKYEEYSKYSLDTYKFSGGSLEIPINKLPQYNEVNFEELALNRYSIRDFGSKVIDDNDIFKALQISTKTPSACNRQSYKVYYIKKPDILKQAIKIQRGLTTHGENLQGLLLITEDTQYMDGPEERNQTFVDGGMFTMSLIYSLTYFNIATCALNAEFDLKREESIRKLLDIPNSENLIAFIALGSFPTKIKAAKSPRDNWKEFTKII